MLVSVDMPARTFTLAVAVAVPPAADSMPVRLVYSE